MCAIILVFKQSQGGSADGLEIRSRTSLEIDESCYLPFFQYFEALQVELSLASFNTALDRQVLD